MERGKLRISRKERDNSDSPFSNSNKWCSYHKATSHNTSECGSIKYQKDSQGNRQGGRGGNPNKEPLGKPVCPYFGKSGHSLEGCYTWNNKKASMEKEYMDTLAKKEKSVTKNPKKGKSNKGNSNYLPCISSLKRKANDLQSNRSSKHTERVTYQPK